MWPRLAGILASAERPSTDGMKGIKWEDFYNHNRPYTLMLLNPGDKAVTISESLQPHNAVNYIVNEVGNGVVYRLPLLVKTSLLKTNCSIVDKIDPYFKCNSPSVGRFDGLSVKIGDRTSADIETLEKAVTPKTPRYAFLLAQAYEQREDYANAIDIYMKHVKSTHKEPQKAFYSQYRIGMCHLKMSQNVTKDAKDSFLKAYFIDPHRKEPLYYLARISRIEKNYPLCLLYSGAALQIGIPWANARFVEGDIYKWRLKEEYALCVYFSGRKDDARQIWVDLLKQDLPQLDKDRITANLKF